MQEKWLDKFRKANSSKSKTAIVMFFRQSWLKEVAIRDVNWRHSSLQPMLTGQWLRMRTTYSESHSGSIGSELFADCAGFPYNKVVTKTLCLVVLDYDRFSRDDPIGEVCLPLGDLDLSAGQTMWKTLAPCKGSLVSNSLLIFHASCF